MEIKSNLSSEDLVTPEEEKRKFMIAVFGGASPEERGDVHFEAAINSSKSVGKIIAEKGYSLITGGYDVGVMKGANEGFKEQLAAQGTTDFTGRISTSTFNAEKYNFPVGKIEGASDKSHDTISERLGDLVDSSSAYLVLSGGAGTAAELVSSINSETTRRAEKEYQGPRPIIIIDTSFKHTDFILNFAKTYRKLAQNPVLGQTYVLNNDEGSLKIAGEILEDYRVLQKAEGAQKAELERQIKEKYARASLADPRLYEK